MMQSTVSSKGRITIPKVVREHLALKAGDRVYFSIREDGTVILKVRNKPIERLFGMLAHKAPQRSISIEEMNPASDPDYSV